MAARDPGAGEAPAPVTPAEYVARARVVRAWTLRHLAHDGRDPSTGLPWRSFRRSTAEPDYSDTWYDASQLLADARLARLGDPAAGGGLALQVRHLEHHRAPADGGYYGRGGVAADWCAGPDQYADDNALVGLALLAAADAAHGPAAAAYLQRAASVAAFLTQSGLWDDTFGGGFWWNSRRGDTIEGKPSQSNGLAALLFLRLHAATGAAHWRVWAERTLAWLDAHLWDGDRRLYRYCVRYAVPSERRGRVVEERYFNYDQGILIECLAEHAVQRGDAVALGRAQAIAGTLEEAFWDGELGGFVLEAGVPQVFLVYSAWLTPALLRLAAVDPAPRWSALARRNAAALHARLHDPTQPGAYAHRAWRTPEGQVAIDPTRHTAAQAWMQHAWAALAAPC